MNKLRNNFKYINNPINFFLMAEHKSKMEDSFLYKIIKL